jgi:DNA polymerase epsilon subunit 1
LEGKSLQECYDSCGEVAERWYDILETEGEYVDDSELIEYIGESRVLSKSIAEYGSRKATSITCAKRLAEFLGNEIVKDKGLCAKFIISKKPVDAKVADRAIPTVIFEEADENVQRKFLRRWLKDASHSDFNIRNIIDWDYYKERLAGTIQKIVTIPAALQKCLNPVPRIKYPDWLHKRLRDNDDKFKQKDMKFFFKNSTAAIKDIEELTPVSKQVVGPINRLSLNSDNKKSNAIKQDAMV